MARPKFEFYAPETLQEACRLLSEKGDESYVLAGGTDLMVKVNHRTVNPRAVIGIKGIKGLDQIRFSKKTGLKIGAMALLSDVASNPAIKRNYPAVAYAAGETANVQIRNMGTLAGNLCNAAPSADNAPALIALDAEVTLMGPEGERRLQLDQFFLGPGMTAIKQGEVLTSITVPPPPPNSGASYQHLSARGKVDISAVGVGAMVHLNGTKCRDVRLCLGAVAPTPKRASKTEKLIRGNRITQALLEKAGIQASKEAKPISDVRANRDYRRKMVSILTKRALHEAYERAKRA